MYTHRSMHGKAIYLYTHGGYFHFISSNTAGWWENKVTNTEMVLIDKK